MRILSFKHISSNSSYIFDISCFSLVSIILMVLHILDLPDDILGLVISRTYVSYYNVQVSFEEFDDVLLGWYHNRIKNKFFNRLPETCGHMAMIVRAGLVPKSDL